jgi:hypothetical protein
MRRWVVVSVGCVLALALVILAAWYFLLRTPRYQASLVVQRGDVTVTSGRDTFSLSAPEVAEIGEGATVQTSNDSSALIAVPTGATVDLEADTQVRIKRLSLPQDGPPFVQLEIVWGDTWHQLVEPADPGARYEIVTPSAVVTLYPSRHHVTVSEGGTTTVQVVAGIAQVKAQSSLVEVQTGEYTSVPPGRAPSAPRALVARSVFVAERSGNPDVWLLDEEGKEVQLTDNEADDLLPAWSPGGTKIAFETDRDGNSEIYVMKSNGADQVNLTRNPAPDHAPVWSPDGTKIAFESERDGGRDIYVMNSDGSEQVKLTAGPGLNVDPRWPTDGQQIVFSRIEGDTNGDGLVDLFDLGTFYVVDEGGEGARGLWGSRMVFEEMIFPWQRYTVN